MSSGTPIIVHFVHPLILVVSDVHFAHKQRYYVRRCNTETGRNLRKSIAKFDTRRRGEKMRAVRFYVENDCLVHKSTSPSKCFVC